MSSLPALFGVLVFTFLLMRVLPGDPAVFFASGPNAGKEEIEVIRKQMGLDKPVPEQLLLYLYDVGRGNLGRSLMTGQAVTFPPAPDAGCLFSDCGSAPSPKAGNISRSRDSAEKRPGESPSL